MSTCEHCDGTGRVAVGEYGGDCAAIHGGPGRLPDPPGWEACDGCKGTGNAERTVEDLQRELLAICRGGRFADAWRKVNDIVQWPSLKSEISKLARINALREQIKAIDPNAALYYGWGGHGDVPRCQERRS
jgi:hypothetical protein